MERVRSPVSDSWSPARGPWDIDECLRRSGATPELRPHLWPRSSSPLRSHREGVRARIREPPSHGRAHELRRQRIRLFVARVRFLAAAINAARGPNGVASPFQAPRRDGQRRGVLIAAFSFRHTPSRRPTTRCRDCSTRKLQTSASASDRLQRRGEARGQARHRRRARKEIEQLTKRAHHRPRARQLAERRSRSSMRQAGLEHR